MTASSTPPPPTHDQARLHLGYLDGLRACAAVFVVLHHNWYTVWLQGVDAAPRWTHWLNYGHFAVDVFIVLSGFCLMLPVVRGGGILRGGAGLFLRKRARRILPPYYAAAALSILLDFLLVGRKTGGFWDSTLPLTWHSVWMHLLLLQDFSAAELHKINYVLWSVSLEWWIYFLFPALVWARRKLGVPAALLLSLGITFALCQACAHFFHDNFTLYYIVLFVFGMLGCEAAHSHQAAIQALRNRLRWDVLTGGAARLTVAAMTGKIRHFSSGDLVDLLVGLVTACLLVALSLSRTGAAGRFLSHKLLLFVGSFAYSVYLVHAPLIQILSQYVVGPLHLTSVPAFCLLKIAGTPIIVVVAYLFHLAFERPFMTRPGVKIKTEAQAEAAAITSPAP